MKEFEYKVTMIVPIYNMEDFLRECLDSLVAQTIAPEEFEILLIDDGSPDNSIDIMNEYAAKYPNMKILRKENEGLSRTRNYGIKRAKGKYIMYIDADDTLSPETVESVCKFFDKHYDEIDLCTYMEIPIIDGEEGRPHYRYKTLVDSGVYDLTRPENVFISQTRVNVCVKNMGEENVLFDLDREFRHEDQKYCIQVVRKKMKIGYCNKGVYYYLHQPQSIVRTFFYAYYIFEKTMKFWEEIFDYYGDGPIPQYIQALYINDVSWKTCSDILLPYHYDEEKLAEAKSRILRLLNKVDDDVILRHPSIDNFHRQFYINLKEGNDIKVMTGPNEITVTNHGRVIYDTKGIEIVLLRFRVKDNKIKFVGFIKSAVFNHLDKPKLFFIRNHNFEKAKEVDLRKSSWNYYRAKLETNNFWLFEQEISLKGLRSFEFKVDVDGQLFDTYYYFMHRVRFNNPNKKNIIYEEGREITFDKGTFYVRKAKEEKYQEYVRKMKRRFRRSDRKLWFLRNLCMKKIDKYENVWLYYDCKGVAKDNGYYQFEHDFDKNDGVQRYYIINEEDFKAKRNQFPRKYHSHMVQFGSLFHKYLYLKSRKIITAFVEYNNYSPFTRKRFAKLNDVNNDADIIYLQHGVLHAHVPWKYSLDRLVIEKEVISTHYEKDNLINNYCFNEKALIPCGMPRYDHIDTEKEPVNRILFAPSWRKYLVGMVGSEWVTTEGKFLNSKFFEETSKFLNSPELEKMLEKNDFYLDFKLHPILERYKHLYEIKNKRVVMAEKTVAETDYKIFMTDFSSFVFDFVYLERPIIYFLPDRDMFRAGMNDYRQIDIPFEDGFGELAISADDAVKAVQNILNNGCKPAPKYAEKMKTFFIHKDNKQSDRLYEALIKE
ncbi:MAG: bifunctional glycosyltransferase family 2 protein/CDP-glycerol:glycerophosphate glycerophosphotransferase [Eubacterium sp.]|nr:bifunctional glycosyltransferase family 2 protein/CDP-glycerol:glycerophosphate glycerophosphotransferase [Eubacterium sp.]